MKTFIHSLIRRISFYSLCFFIFSGLVNTLSAQNCIAPPSVNITANGPTRLCTGSSVTLSAGGAGNAIQFNGIGDVMTEVEYPSKTLINGTSITLSAWIYPTAWKGNYWENTIISNESVSSEGYSLRCGDNGTLNFSLGDGTQWYQLTTDQNALALNTWQHVAATYDGNSMILYINGVEVALQPLNISIVSNSNLYAGNYSNYTRGFSGALDEVQVWKTALTSTQIQDCMSGNTSATSPGLVAYFKMDPAINYSNNVDATGNVNFIYSGCQQIASAAPVDNYATFLWSNGATGTSTTVNEGGKYAVTVTDASGCSTTSDSIQVIADSVQGDTSVFGDSTWNFYFWNSSGYTQDKNIGAINPGDSWSSNYAGYYSDTTLNFNTANLWSPNGAPSDASGYHGCPVQTSLHSWSAKRKGFPCGYYKLDISNATPNNYVELFVNDTLVFQGLGGTGNAWTGWLSSNDKIEYRAAESLNQYDYGAINFGNSFSISGPSFLCIGGTVQLSASYFSGTNYLWSNGATGDTITVTAGGNYSVSVTNLDGCKAAYMLPEVTPPNISMNDTSICQGSVVALQANGNAYDYFFTPVTNNLVPHAPLDNIPGTFLAVGLHKLISSYTGPCIRLIRFSDYTQKDFGFVGDSLDMKAIISWLGGTGGYCETLYDQSGHGNNFAGQQYNGQGYPFFIAFDQINGNSVIRLVPNTTLYKSSISLPSQFTVIYGSQLNGQDQQVLSDGPGNWYLGYSNGAKHQAYFNGWVTPSNNKPAADDSFYVYTGSYDGTNAHAYENGTLIGNTNGNFQGPIDLFINSLSHPSDANFTDLVIFNRVLADAERQTVENAIINYKQEASRVGQFTIHPDSTTRYNLTGTDLSGCSATKIVTVTVNPSKVYYRDVDGDGYGNPNDSVKACSAPAGYVSNNTDCDDTHATVYPGAPEICDGLDNDCNGIIDDGCYSSIVLKATTTAASSCANDGTIKLTASGGKPPYIYSIDGYNFVSTNTFTSLANGSYTGYVKDSRNAVNSVTITVARTATLTVNSSVVNASACLDDGKITLGRTGGTSPFMYSLDGNNYVSTNVFSNLIAGSYTGYVKDAKGCIGTKQNITLGKVAAITVSSSTVNASACLDDGKITLGRTGGTSPFMYSLDGTNYGSSNIFSNLATGSYTGYVKDAKGCTAMKQNIVVGKVAAITVSSSTVNASYCLDDGKITLGRTGGTSPFMYSLDGTNYGSSNIFSNLATSSYTGYVKDAKGCTGIKQNITIGKVAAITVSSSTVNASYCLDDGKITLGRTGGTSPFMYSLDGTNYGSSNIFSNLATSSYTGYVKDAKGCTGIKQNITIGKVAAITVSSSTVNASYCLDDGKITLGRTGGTSPFMYSLDGNSYVSTNVFSNLVAGSYTGYVKDAKGCIGIKQNITVNKVAQLSVTYSKTNSTICPPNGTITLKVTGGTSPYLYSIDGSNYGTGAKFIYVAPGTYTGYIKDAKCPVVTVSNIIITGPSCNNNTSPSIAQKIESGSSVEVSPVPANAELNVRLSGYTGNVTVQIISMEGVKLGQKKSQGKTGQPCMLKMDVSTYASAMYMLVVTDEKGNQTTKKIIIAH